MIRRWRRRLRAPRGDPHTCCWTTGSAEHVPGCNMAFRREALVAIGGFNPLYLRAGGRCWTFAGGCGREGGRSDSPRARSCGITIDRSVKVHWRQQVGYGEGERLLMAHHPDKFLDGRMLWRQPHLQFRRPPFSPFVGTRINCGVWERRRRSRRSIGPTFTLRVPSAFSPVAGLISFGS